MEAADGRGRAGESELAMLAEFEALPDSFCICERGEGGWQVKWANGRLRALLPMGPGCVLAEYWPELERELSRRSQSAIYELTGPEPGRVYEISSYPRPGGGVGCVVRDVTVERMETAALTRSETLYRTLIESASDAILLSKWERQPRFVAVNGQAGKVLGYTRQELLGMGPWDLVAGVSEVRLDELTQLLRRGGRAQGELEVVANGGRRVPVELSARRISMDGTRYVLSILRDVSERREAEERLRDSELRFSEAFYHVPLPMTMSTSREGRFYDVNERFLEISGYRREELIGKTSAEVGWVTGEDRRRVGEAIRRHGCVPPMEMNSRTKDGQVIPFEVRGQLMSFGGESYLLMLAQDLRERRVQAQERETTLRLLQLLDSANDTKELIRTVTQHLHEWTECEAVGVRLKDGEDYPYYLTQGFGAEFVQMENSLCQRDGGGCVVRDEDGHARLECMCGIVLEGRTIPGEKYYTTHGSFWTNASSELVEEVSEETLGTKLRGRCVRSGYESIALVPLRAGQTRGLLQLNDRRRGRFTPEMIQLLERIAASIAIALDQKRAQAALREAEARYRDISLSMADWIFEVDEEFRITYLSEHAGQLLGYEEEELMGQRVPELLVTEPAWQAEAVQRRFDEGGNFREAPMRALTKDGGVVELEVSAVAQFGRDGKLRGYRGVLRDVTERNRAQRERAEMEEQLAQAQKMDSIGRVAGGIAHDFNNLLTVINGYSEILRNEMARGRANIEHIEQVRKAGEKAAELTQHLLSFSRKQAAEPKPIEMNRLIEEDGDVLRRLAGEAIEVRIELEPGLGAVVADRAQLQQVLMNLTVNARDAMPKGGVLGIRTMRTELATPKPGAYVLLEVSDTGCGMDEETRKRVFEPFFTTKGKQQGTGLGLSIVYNAVRQCGGWTRVDSEPGRGTRMKVFLPMTELAAPEPGRVVAERPAGEGGETVLVVEDQDAVRHLSAEILRGAGYDVLEASGGPEALEMVGRAVQRIDLMLTDIVMPRMTGIELAQRMAEAHPEVKVLFMSGYAEQPLVDESVLRDGSNFIGKPFAADALLGKVRGVLSGGKQRGRILVAEDEAPVRRLFATVLRRHGYEVMTAVDGEQASKMLKEQRFDLLLSDLVMPNKEGLEVLREVRAKYPAMRVIAVSGAFGGSMLRVAELLGADATLAKPVTAAMLAETVKRILEMKEGGESREAAQ